MPRVCFVLRGLSRLSLRLDVSCTMRSFGNVTRFVSDSLFHTTSTKESMLDERGSFSWCLGSCCKGENRKHLSLLRIAKVWTIIKIKRKQHSTFPLKCESFLTFYPKMFVVPLRHLPWVYCWAVVWSDRKCCWKNFEACVAGRRLRSTRGGYTKEFWKKH